MDWSYFANHNIWCNDFESLSFLSYCKSDGNSFKRVVTYTKAEKNMPNCHLPQIAAGTFFSDFLSSIQSMRIFRENFDTTAYTSFKFFFI